MTNKWMMMILALVTLAAVGCGGYEEDFDPAEQTMALETAPGMSSSVGEQPVADCTLPGKPCTYENHRELTGDTAGRMTLFPAGKTAIE